MDRWRLDTDEELAVLEYEAVMPEVSIIQEQINHQDQDGLNLTFNSPRTVSVTFHTGSLKDSM